MFGYVAVNQPELKVKDYNRYREYYCGVCQALRKNYGISGQISLTYDATFVAILLTALYEPETKRKSCHCIVHPVGEKVYVSNSAVEYAAAMNLVLGYYKCLDDWKDDRDFLRLSYSGIIRNQVKRIKQQYGKKVAVIRDKIRELEAYESKMQAGKAREVDPAHDNKQIKSDFENIDVPAGFFGVIMSEILAVGPEELQKNAGGHDGEKESSSYCEDWSEELGRLGYHLGKFIYIMDAYDDVEDDVRRGRFNPFTEKYHSMEKEAFKKWVGELLMMIASDMAKEYEKLPIVEEVNILRNIIYSGIWCRFFNDGENTGRHHLRMERRCGKRKETGKDRQV